MSEIQNIFPISNPLYSAKRDFCIDEKERKEIDAVIAEGMSQDEGNTSSTNKFLLDSKLSGLKSFCEKHIDNYVNQVLSPKNKSLDFYITQSWLNITKPEEHHEIHYHPNSIISGVYYITDDCEIIFSSPFVSMSHKTIIIESDKPNSWNTTNWNEHISVWEGGTLILFPSYLMHRVPKNTSSSVRISIALNVFVRGDLGTINNSTFLRIE